MFSDADNAYSHGVSTTLVYRNLHGLLKIVAASKCFRFRVFSDSHLPVALGPYTYTPHCSGPYYIGKC